MYRVFIASPGGLETERQGFRDAIAEYNESDAVHRNVLFSAIGWEATLPGIGRPQELINSDVIECDFFVLLLWDRWGSSSGSKSDGRRFSSGTEEEYLLGLECLNAEDRPMRELCAFFKLVDIRQLNDPGTQLQKVLDFKADLEKGKVLLYQTFDDVAAFKIKITQLLAKWLREHEGRQIAGTPQLPKNHQEPQFTSERRTEIEAVSPGFINPDSDLVREGYEAIRSGYVARAEAIFSSIISKSADEDDLIDAMCGLAEVREQKQQFEEAISLIQGAIDVSQRNHLDADNRARIFVQLGAVQLRLGRVGKSLDAFRAGASTAEGNDSPIVAAFATEWLATAYSFPHDFQNAQQSLRKAQALRAGSDPDQESLVSWLDIRLALISIAIGDFSNARRIALEVSAATDPLRVLESLPTVNRLQAWLAWRSGNRSEADRLFKESLNLAEQRNSANSLELIPFLEDLAVFSMQLGRFRESEFYANRITEFVREHFSARHPLVGIHSLPLGWLYANRKGYEQAEEIARSAIIGFQRLGLRGCPRESTAYFVMAVTALHTDRKELALEYFEQARDRLRSYNPKLMPLAKEITRCVGLIKSGRPLAPGNFSWKRIPIGPQSFSRH